VASLLSQYETEVPVTHPLKGYGHVWELKDCWNGTGGLHRMEGARPGSALFIWLDWEGFLAQTIFQKCKWGLS